MEAVGTRQMQMTEIEKTTATKSPKMTTSAMNTTTAPGHVSVFSLLSQSNQMKVSQMTIIQKRLLALWLGKQLNMSFLYLVVTL